MKKIAILLISVSILFLFGCVSTSSVSTSPSEIEYKEISGKDYFSSSNSNLYSAKSGYKLQDVFILGAETKYENGTTEVLLKIANEKDAWGDDVRYVYATDFIKNINEQDSTWIERLDAVRNDQKFNGHYTVYLYEKKEGNFFVGYITKVFVYNIEGVPSQEEIASAKAAKEEAEKKAKAEKYAALDAKAKTLAQGYIYHGVEDVKMNCKLFINGALEAGNAYFISGFVVKYGGSMAKIEYGDGLFFSSQSSAVYVDYISQKVKGEVIEAGVTNLLGRSIEIPVTVVVAGGKSYSKTPVVLGIVEE